MKENWWKYLTVGLLFFVLWASLMNDAPRLAILNETIRNLHYHVPMWFGMMGILTISFVHSILYLRNPNTNSDYWAVEAANTGILYGALGLITGMIWAQFTWGDFWSNDPKQLVSAVAWLIYLAYLLLRGSIEDPDQKAKISAVYNIFAFSAYIPLIYILPRLVPSLHPGASGNPGFNTYDLDSGPRMVFYPAVIGWFLLGLWMTQLRVRLRKLETTVVEEEEVQEVLVS